MYIMAEACPVKVGGEAIVIRPMFDLRPAARMSESWR
jgi:hypothetical protein